MQRVNILKRDDKSYSELLKKSMQNQNTRTINSRVLLYDGLQPIKNGDPLQSTNSIFKKNELVASRRKFQQI